MDAPHTPAIKQIQQPSQARKFTFGHDSPDNITSKHHECQPGRDFPLNPTFFSCFFLKSYKNVSISFYCISVCFMQ